MSDPRSLASRHGSYPQSPDARLDSWKAVAQYLGRHVATVRRWEQQEGLPVHRHQHEKRGSVYGYPAELDAWLAARSSGAVEPARPIQATSAVAALAPPGSATEHPASIDASANGDAATLPQPHRPLWRNTLTWVLPVAVLGLTVGGVIAESLWSAVRTKDQTISLAVLPLENRSSDQQLDYFVDGMTEALMTDLAALSDIRVIARQSVVQYRDSGKPASAIASELRADALVEGGVQLSGGRVRVDIRLIQGSTSRTLWATTYERDLGNALALQAEIGRAIAGELHLTLDPSQRERLAKRRPANHEAWDAYLRARFFWNQRTHAGMSRAVEWYERAIQRDPSFPLAYAGLADVYATLGPPNMPPSELIARGTAAAQKAIELDPLMGEPLAALGRLRSYAWDWEGAESNYRKAIQRSPGYAPARYWYGSFLANQGRCDEAFSQAREAERLDPVSLPGNVVVSGIELRCNRVQQAISRNRMVLDFDPGYGQSYESLGRAYLSQGNGHEAVVMLDKAVKLTGRRATVLATLAYAYASTGRTHAAEAIAEDLAGRHTRDKGDASAWSVAIVHAGLRRDDAALTWLEHAYEDREEWLEALAADHRFRHLHGHERFQRLLERLRLPKSDQSAVTVLSKGIAGDR
jgi:TolB-like protein